MTRSSLCLVIALAACDRGHRDAPPPVASGSAPTTAPSAPASTCKLDPIPLRRPMPRRLVAIGDLHGDLAATRAALRTAGAIDEADRWIGGELVVVQTGDVLDRGDDEQAIIDLLLKLEPEAKAAGGALIVLLGNHELMNAAADFRYVTPGGFADFADVPNLPTAKWQQAPEAVRPRIAALAPGGPYAKRLGAHAVIAIVGDTVFSHAGVLGRWTAEVDRANQTARCWLDGQAGSFREPPAVLASDDSPVWTRAIGGDPADCTAATSALGSLGAKRMVVGHTVQQGGITSACDGAVWRIDVGLAKGYGGPIEVLELTPDAPPKVLKGTRL
ncbi:MAG TPA: metallophosphoesterase [Kofleriaceae bacterium]|nr:metallophosphoesterase [Kofleriaceae bacterium]